MIRRIAITFAFVATAALPAMAQQHSTTHSGHSQGGHSQAGHAQAAHHAAGADMQGMHLAHADKHAAMHALLMGSWSGTFSSPHSDASTMTVTAVEDSTWTVTVKLGAEQPIRAGAASAFMFHGENRIGWTQILSGVSCKVTAVVTEATVSSPASMEGTIACEQGQLEFSLQKKGG